MLENWFDQRAGQDEKRNMARVFVAIDDQLGVLGFYSLSSFTLTINDLPADRAKRLPRYDLIPAALIGRLHRQNAGKTEVLVVDYVDEGGPPLLRMAAKRRAGYRALGYTFDS